MNRAELHLHTNMSEDVSIIHPEEALSAAVELGCTAIAFVDKNSVHSFSTITELQHTYRNKITILYGAQVAVEGVPLTLLVKNLPILRR